MSEQLSQSPQETDGIRRFESLGSTNDEARAWAREGAPDLSLVVAHEQTGGRGRRGRSWASPAGAGFYGSLIARPGHADEEEPSALLSRWSIGAAVGVARALSALGMQAGLKWPNDVLLNGRKVAGVLCEAEWRGSRPEFVIVGVGLNVRHRREDLPERPLFPATSLLLESGQDFEDGRVELALTESLRGVARDMEGSGWESLRLEWQSRCAGMGDLVSVSQGERKTLGVLKGLDEDGALLVATAEGMQRVVVGDVAFE